MKSKAKIKQEISDWKFVFMAMRNGDGKALKAINRLRAINHELELTKNECTQCLPVFRITYIDRMILLEKEKKSLLFDYEITKKKAKIYIETLRRRNREETKLSKQ